MKDKQIIDAYQKYYLEHCEATPYKGVIETLKVLHKKRKKIGIFSNKPISIAYKQVRQLGICSLLNF